MGLSEPETGLLLNKQLGRDVPADLARLLYQKTDGNPLFLRELSEGIMASGQSDSDALRDAPGLSPPELVRRVLLRRVERLGEHAQTLLSAAAVVGNSFELSCLAQVTGMDRELVSDVVDVATASRVIVPLPDRVESFRFAHELIRDTLYSELRSGDRKRLHQKVADYLSQQSMLHGQGVKEIALHYYRALPEVTPQSAIGWLSRAAEECEREAAFDDAARFYRSALDALRLMSEPDAAQLTTLNQALERVGVRQRAAKSAN
jgi:predicted ATPase